MHREFLFILPMVMSRGRGGAAVSPSSVPRPPEEIQLAAIGCIRFLLHLTPFKSRDVESLPASSSSQKGSFDKSNTPLLAPLISALLDTALVEKHLLLRQTTLDTLQAVVSPEIIYDREELVKFLPGITSTLCKLVVAHGSSGSGSIGKIHHSVLVASIRILQDLIVRCFDDKSISSDDSSTAADEDPIETLRLQLANASTTTNNSNINSSHLSQETRKWLDTTVPRISSALSVLFSIRAHPHPKVRLSFVHMTSSILKSCCASALLPCMSLLLETLVLYCTDEYDEVASACRSSLHSLSATTSQYSVKPQLRKNLYILLQSLPQHLLSSNENRGCGGGGTSDAKKLETILLVNGYLLVLKDNICVTLATCLDTVALGLLKVLSFDLGDVLLVADKAPAAMDNLDVGVSSGVGTSSSSTTCSSNTFRHRFKYFHDERIVSGIITMCRLLGYYGNLTQLFQHFLSAVSTNNSNNNSMISASTISYYSKQQQHHRQLPDIHAPIDEFKPAAVFVLNQMALGSTGIGIEHLVNIEVGGKFQQPIASLHSTDGISLARFTEINEAFKLMMGVYVYLLLQPYYTSLVDMELYAQFNSGMSSMGTEQPGNLLQNSSSNLDYHHDSSFQNLIPHFNHTIITQSLLLEGIGNVATVLQSNFQCYLIDSLYPIMEKLGDSSRGLSEAAMCTCIVIAQATVDVSSVPSLSPTATSPPINHNLLLAKHLVLENIDYIVNSAALKFKYIQVHPRVPMLLASAIRVAGIEVLPFTSDLIQHVMDALDKYWRENPLLVVMLLKVIKSLVAVVADVQLDDEDVREEGEDGKFGHGVGGDSDGNTTTPLCKYQLGALSKEVTDVVEEIAKLKAQYDADKAAAASSSSGGSHPLSTLEEIRDFFNEHQRKKAAADEEEKEGGEVEGVKEEEEEVVAGETADISTPPPPASRDEKLVIQILDKLQHFLISTNPRVRCLVMEIIKTAIPTLKSPHRQQDLFPLIHALWPSIVERLGDKEHYVRLEAISVVECICKYCKNFVSRRVVDDIWPRLRLVAKDLKHSERPAIVKQHRNNLSSSSSSSASSCCSLQEEYISVHLKARLGFLDCLSRLVKHVPMKNEDVQQVEEMVYPFLNVNRYGKQVKQQAVQVMKSLAALDPDGVWLLLSMLVERTPAATTAGEISIPASCLANARETGSPEDYKEAVEEIKKG